MAIVSHNKKTKLYVGNKNTKRVFAGDKSVYSAANICTYHVDGATYQEEVDEGESCLSPTSFTVPEKSGYMFVGWSLEKGGDALADLTMGGDPIVLYAVWIEAKLTAFAKSAMNAAPTINKTGYYSISTGTVTSGASISVPVAGYVCFDSKGSGGGENSGYSYLHIKLGVYKKATIVIGLSFSKNSDTASAHVNHLQVTGATSGNGVFYWADSNGSEKILTLTSSGTITMKHNTDFRSGSASRYWIKSIVLEV